MSVESIGELVVYEVQGESFPSKEESAVNAVAQKAMLTSIAPSSLLVSRETIVHKKERIPEGFYSFDKSYPLFEKYIFEELLPNTISMLLEANQKLVEEKLQLEHGITPKVLVFKEITMYPGRNHPSGGEWRIYWIPNHPDVQSSEILSLTYISQKDGFLFNAGPPTMLLPIMGEIMTDPLLTSDILFAVKSLAKSRLPSADEEGFEQGFTVSDSYYLEFGMEHPIMRWHVKTCGYELEFVIMFTPAEGGGTDFCVHLDKGCEV